MESPIIPLGDKIVILPQEEGEQMYGNIIVPDAGQEIPEKGTVFENMNTCQLFEYDIVELFSRMDNANDPFTKFAIGYNLQEKYKCMKKAGCPKPARIKQEDWDRA